MPITIITPRMGQVALPPSLTSFTFTGSCPQTINLSALPGTAVVTVKAWGAGGGNGSDGDSRGAAGGFAKATFLRSALPTGMLDVCIGGGGGNGNVGGFNGGGDAGGASPFGGKGGGLSSVFDGATILVVGGGGGGGAYTVGTVSRAGGPGGGSFGSPDGQAGEGAHAGLGGTLSAGGAGGVAADGPAFDGTAGSAYQGGTSPTVSSNYGGGGGGGYYGGGGGASAATSGNVGGAGGGSSYISGLASTTLFDGANPGVDRYTPPQTGDTDYVAGVAAGNAGSGAVGGPGLIVISWA